MGMLPLQDHSLKCAMLRKKNCRGGAVGVVPTCPDTIIYCSGTVHHCEEEEKK